MAKQSEVKYRSSRSARRLVRQVFLSLIFLATVMLWAIRTNSRDYENQRVLALQETPYFRSLQNSQELLRPAKNISVNLVVASVRADDITWTSHISNIPNLRVVRYVWDDSSAPYHPTKKRGNEAMMYHTYLHDFYDKLPDMSIFIHAHDMSWHTEPYLFSSLQYAVSHLDLDQVLQRQYVNLRVGWQNACPAWIKTNISKERDPQKPEQVHMHQAFREIFSSKSKTPAVPEILAQPCCSQFAVSKAAIQSVSKTDYAHYIEWLSATDLSDNLSGRVWEHLWQYLFTRKAVDCPVAWKALCRTYHICFDNAQDLEAFMQLEYEKEWLIFGRSFWKELWDPESAARGRQRVHNINEAMGKQLSMALDRGKYPSWRNAVGDLYLD
ncbi:hypothetical protein PVAG01_04743 [Phlyctema vagabunda]|uniref:Uncharacterized protein n=1 Tax=Phlyctema vagabunda TaxID=108571 RepID=A0ABR4PI34_9HELO